MAAIQIKGFMGENRAIHPMLLQETLGVTSRNQKPGRGDLRPVKGGLKVATIPAGRGTIYRVPGTQGDLGYWVSWPGLVHPALGFEDEAASKKVFYTGDGHPKVFMRSAISASVTDANTVQDPTLGWRPLGIPAPTAPPGVIGSPPAATTEVVAANISTIEIANGVCTLTTQTPTTFQGGDSVVIAITAPVVFNGTQTILGVNSSTSFSISNGGGAVALTTATGTATVTRTTSTASESGDYAYCFTRVNDWGWESAPSPATALIQRPTNGSTLVQDLTLGTGFNVNRVRVYVTQSGSNSSDFFFLAESTGASVVHNADSKLGEPLPTNAYLPAPGLPIGGLVNLTEDNLTNLTPLWNGMLAGISGTGIRFCEAYTPYSWPGAYNVIPPDAIPVALGVFEQNLLVLTDGRPCLISGSGPDSMDMRPIDVVQACVAPKSVVSMGHGVVWASNDGLMYFGSGGAKNLTAGVMTRDDWQLLVPSTISGQMHEGLYYGSYNDGTSKAFMLDPSNPTGIYFFDAGRSVTYYDEPLDQLYLLAGTEVQKWDAGTPLTATFKSKVFHLPKPVVGFACAEVVADAHPATFKLYADGALKHTQTTTSSKPFRLPSGYYGQNWQVEVSTQSGIQGVSLAHSMKELAST